MKMSQMDEDRILLNEQAEQASEDGLKLVPVTESIRYRKRAQSAEKKVEDLTKQLADARAQASQTAEQLNDMRLERELLCRLSSAGAVDLEAALLLAKGRIADNQQPDIEDCVKKLKSEKSYLFGESSVKVPTAAQKTAAVKDRRTGRQAVLERAAKQAATTGNRADLQQYLKLRRNFL